MKRALDFFVSFAGLAVLSPLILIILLLVWLQDYKSPFYVGQRAAKGGQPFGMIKIRSMVSGADKSGVDSTSADDMRITQVGHFIRRYKIDELSQLLNVLLGTMSLVGPRPNTITEIARYTDQEKRLLSVKPGITDLASIVFSDEGEILKGSEDPDHSYDILIRPWKSRLGLVYIENSSISLDIRIIYLTLVAIVSKPSALKGLEQILIQLGCDPELIEVARRRKPLEPGLPPGAAPIAG